MSANNTYVFEEVELEEEEVDEFNYDEVSDLDSEGEDVDDFKGVLNSLKAQPDVPDDVDPTPVPARKNPAASQTSKPTVVDDFIINFLIKLKMTRALDAFQTEWYEMKKQGLLNEEDVGAVPDLYERNVKLDDQVKQLREEVEKYKAIAAKAKGTWNSFRKERDFHRMHHRRVVQEKNMLVRDMKRLKAHYSTFEPALKSMRKKYEDAMKDRTLMKLERDRMAMRTQTLEAQVKNWEDTQKEEESKQAVPQGGGAEKKKNTKKEATAEDKGATQKGKTTTRRPRESQLPPDDRINPYLEREYDPALLANFSQRKSFKGHSMAISGMALHPTKPVLATVSDDLTWKLWSLPKGELIMSGDGHKDWLSACEFHPRGSHLATASGDGTVKLWDFTKTKCAATFTDHTQAVWDIAFHDQGDFLVSCSMDHTAKLWDLNTSVCRNTLRGHVDSINSVVFQPYSNNVCTASGDKTVSLWDIRSGLCIQTFYGHDNAVLSCAFSKRGDTIVSSDADGVLKGWDVRMVQERLSIAVGAERESSGPVNDLCFDTSGRMLACAGEDGVISVYDLTEGVLVHTLEGHTGPVQKVLVDPNSQFLVSAASDATFKLWS